MDVYGTEQIRNVVLLGHGGAGKTTVAEAMALITGVTKRMGKVADGNTISDYDKEEIKRQFSISTTLIPLEYQGENGPVKINLLDTPGFFDFVGEVEEAISVADAAPLLFFLIRSNTWIRFWKLQRSIPASGSSKTESFAFLAITVAISILFNSPPERLALISRLI